MDVRASASAPGKITLCGEHAVVYGVPAIAIAIDRRIRVDLAERDDGRLVINLPDIAVKGVRVIVEPSGESVAHALGLKAAEAYVVQALKIASKRFGGSLGLNVEVHSAMPVGAGLGTSAAISVATMAAYAALRRSHPSKQELAQLGREVEFAVQGVSSGMDATVAAYGGTILYQPRQDGFSVESLQVDSKPIFAVGYTERIAPTAESVRFVSELKSRYPSVVGKIIGAIEEIVSECRRALEEGDLRHLGELMNMNHGLLSALGVSTVDVERIVHVARGAGALGAKITGGGMGGSVICLCDNRESLEKVVSSLWLSGYKAFAVTQEKEGVQLVGE